MAHSLPPPRCEKSQITDGGRLDRLVGQIDVQWSGKITRASHITPIGCLFDQWWENRLQQS